MPPKTKKKIGGRGNPRAGDAAMDVKVPKTGPGNSKQDQAWLESQIKAGMIEDIGEDETDVPFGAMRRWTGLQADIGSSWQLPDEAHRCSAHARVRDHEGRYVVDADNEVILRPCMRAAIRGGKVCVTHGGGIARVRQAAQVRLAGAADKLIGQLIRIALDPKVDPHARVKAINSALDRAGINQKIEVEVGVPGFQEMLDEMFGNWGDDEEGEGS